jgi:peptidoglycan/LPS O-acetylase OafA/YrhL
MTSTRAAAAQRTTPTRDRTFPTLNAVRGAGALMVVATHSAFNTGQILQGWTGGVLARLDFGVPLFFILSGFLLSRPFFLAIGRGDRTPSVRHYLWKRFLRVMPLYWVMVVVALALDPANRGLGWEVWVRNLTLTQLYFPTLLPESLTQMWSLCTEVLFYLLMPAFAIVLARSRRHRGLHLPTIWWRSLVLAALGVAWQAWFAHVPGSHGHYLQWLPGWMPDFLVGMAFAAASASLTLRPRRHVLDRMGSDLVGCWILATALFAIACTPVAGPRTLALPLGWEAATKVVLYCLAGAFYCLPLMFGPELDGRIRTALAGPTAVWLGDISYGVYAIHLFVMGVLFRALDITPFTGHFATILALDVSVTVLLATLSWRYLESRILRFKNVRRMMRAETPATRADLEFQQRAGRH